MDGPTILALAFLYIVIRAIGPALIARMNDDLRR